MITITLTPPYPYTTEIFHSGNTDSGSHFSGAANNPENMQSSNLLEQLADDFASAVPIVDSEANHDRWQAGIGPFEEERQVKMIQDTIKKGTPYSIQREKPYPDRRQQCDLFVGTDETQIPIEAKLLRFRYDNSNIDPNSFAKVFSPFPERRTSTLLTDARNLHEAGFERNGGLLGLYYEPKDESYEQMSAEAVAEKFCLDIEYWYDFSVDIVSVAHFEGLRHPVHQRGAIVIWEVESGK